jgi:translation initiation factor 1
VARGRSAGKGNLRGMSRKPRREEKLPLVNRDDFGSSPFDLLSKDGLPVSLPGTPSLGQPKPKEVRHEEKMGQGARLEIRREKSGRGGKTVTTIAGFPSRVNAKMRMSLLKRIKTRLGTGGTWNGDCMELQGDKREEVVPWLSSLGFKPVLAGG